MWIDNAWGPPVSHRAGDKFNLFCDSDFVAAIILFVHLQSETWLKHECHLCIEKYQIACFTNVIAHFYVLLTLVPRILSFNCAPLWLLSCKLWIRCLLLSLNGGVSFSKGSLDEPSVGGGGVGTLGMLLFCELLCSLWKERASLPSRKWTALPLVMMHNWYTFIHSCEPQYYASSNLTIIAKLMSESKLHSILYFGLVCSLITLIYKHSSPPSPHLLCHPLPPDFSLAFCQDSSLIWASLLACCWFPWSFRSQKQAQWEI